MQRQEEILKLDPLGEVPEVTLGGLQKALRQGGQASSDLAGLDEDYQDAYARANTPTAQATGDCGGVLQEIGNTATRYFGKKDLMGLKQARANARSGVAKTAMTEKNYGLQQARNKIDRDQTNVENKAGALVKAAELKDTNAREAARTAAEKAKTAATAKGKTVNVYSVDDPDKEAFAVRVDGNGNLTGKGGKPLTVEQTSKLALADSSNGGVSVDVNTADADRTVYGKDNKGVEKDTLEASNRVNELKKIYTAGVGLSSKDSAEMSHLGTKLKTTIIKALPLGGLEDYIADNLSKLSPEGKAWAMSVAADVAKGKHSLYGAALSRHEDEAAGEFLIRVLAMPKAEVLRSLKTAALQNFGIVENNDRIYGGGDGRNFLQHTNGAWLKEKKGGGTGDGTGDGTGGGGGLPNATAQTTAQTPTPTTVGEAVGYAKMNAAELEAAANDPNVTQDALRAIFSYMDGLEASE